LKKNLLLSVLSALLLTFPFVSNMSGFILFIGFLPLFFIEKQFSEQKNNYKPIVFFNYAYLTFGLWNLFTLWWTANSAWFSVLPPVLLNSFFMAVVFLVFHIAHRNLPEKFAYSTLVFFWLAFEYLHFNWFLAFPWLTLGNAFSNDLYAIQWYEFSGVLGGSFWILLVNVLIFRMIRLWLKFKTPRAFILESLAFLFLVFAPILFSQKLKNNYIEEKNPIQIAIIQPNIDSYTEKYNANLQISNFNKNSNLINKITQPVDFIVAPETTVSRDLEIIWQENYNASQSLAQLRNLLKNKPQANMILGINSFKKAKKTQQNLATVNYDKGLNVYYEAFSSAIQLNLGDEIQAYHKSKFVLGVEKMPFANLFPWLDNLMVDFGGIVGSLASDTERKILTNSQNSAKVGVPICYETLFGEFVSEFAKNGASVLFVITNDGWWGNTPGYRQHAKLSQLRAIENRRSVARAANTGISSFINPLGETIKASNYDEETLLIEKLNLNTKLTYYTKNGDFIGRIAAFFAILFLLYLFVQLKAKKIK